LDSPEMLLPFSIAHASEIMGQELNRASFEWSGPAAAR